MNPDEILPRFFKKSRSRLVVEIDIDPVPGWGDSPEWHRDLVQRYLDETVPHYNPTVVIAVEEQP